MLKCNNNNKQFYPIIQIKMQGSISKHGLFGRVRLVHKYIGTALEYQCTTKTRQDAIRWQQLQKINSTLNTNNLLVPIQISKSCSGEQTQWKLVYADYMYVLEHQRGNREGVQDKFTQAQLWYLLYNMVETSKTLLQVGLNLGTPCGSTILLNQYGNIQILCQLSLPNIKQIQQSRKLTFAPEQLQAKNNPTLTIGLDRSKSQAFNIGMTILQLGTLRKCDCIYERFKPEVIGGEIAKFLEEFGRGYSPFLTRILGSMVKIKFVDRSSTGEVWAALKPYSESINNIKHFEAVKDITAKSLKNYLKTHHKVL